MLFQGVNTPVITIMKEDGSIDYDNMEKHIEHLVQAGINGLLFLGSLGEFYALQRNEKEQLIKFAVKTVSKRTQVIIGVGDTCWQRTVQLMHYAEKVGADAINIVSPYYFAPSRVSVLDYFERTASETTLPIMLYNFPDRTGNDLSPEIVYKLVRRCENILGIKDTVNNISHTRSICQAIKAEYKDFAVLSGYDEYYIPNRIAGGDGVLCGLTNVMPELFVQMHQAYENGDFKEALTCAKKVSILMQLYQVTDLFITAIKTAVKMQGLPISTYTHLPGNKVIPPGQYQQIKSILFSVVAQDGTVCL